MRRVHGAFCEVQNTSNESTKWRRLDLSVVSLAIFSSLYPIWILQNAEINITYKYILRKIVLTQLNK